MDGYWQNAKLDMGAYSNSIIVDEPNRERVYIHSSHAYADNKTNILAWWVDKI